MKKLKTWETEEYYDMAEVASKDVSHPAMVQLIKLAREADKVLDLGCGEGTKLASIKPKNGFGIDLSKLAISKARKKYPKYKFENDNLEKLPYKNDEFDLAYSAYVLEHTSDPEKVLSEAFRVLKSGGKLLLVAPNYGAPNRASPPAKYSRAKKLILNFVFDLKDHSSNINWLKVKPLNRKYFSDSDTTIEPYLRTLENYLTKKLKMKIIYKSSLWSQELPNPKPHQKIFKLLSKFNVYPFYYWGPHLFIIAKK